MFKYIILVLSLCSMSCLFYEAKFDQALMGNAIVVDQYVNVSEALDAFIDIAMKQNANNPAVIQTLIEWQDELNKSNRKVGEVSATLLQLVETSGWPEEIQQSMIQLFFDVVEKWVVK